ncbi:hypothetical protein C1Y40_01923 [Mycobacterium talmoniae]|uniref:TPM domain-containing protein n=1 Tax=Mycobacterium talmoniae TaxID=1858794 RepID=A0A2S8BMK0_9MYCO|nr:hypothetical protein C1Y40_01923 [Mycobacterium talmoniae]
MSIERPGGVHVINRPTRGLRIRLTGMRVARLLGTILALLTAGALLAPAGAADPPARLTDYITDNAGVLNSISRGQVWGHVDSLYTERHVRLWVVYVHNFSGESPESWARDTIRMNYLSDHDALLAVATDDRSYAFLVPTAIKNVSSGQVDELRRNQIEPALHRGDWAGAAVAARIATTWSYPGPLIRSPCAAICAM